MTGTDSIEDRVQDLPPSFAANDLKATSSRETESPISSTSECSVIRGEVGTDLDCMDSSSNVSHLVPSCGNNVVDRPSPQLLACDGSKNEMWVNHGEAAEDREVQFRVDDRFASSLNFCDAHNLQHLRWNRCYSPIIIHEKEDEEEESDSFIPFYQTDTRLKSFLNTPNIHRRACGWGSEETPFVIQNIGSIHSNKVPRIFISQ